MRGAAGQMIELHVCVNGRLRDATLGRVERKRLPHAVDVEDERGLTNGGNYDFRVFKGRGSVDWMEWLHGEPDRITARPAAMREALWSAA